jgi:hypothetical protein
MALFEEKIIIILALTLTSTLNRRFYAYGRSNNNFIKFKTISRRRRLLRRNLSVFGNHFREGIAKSL